MNTISSWQTALIASWGEVWTAFLRILPTIIGAILVFAIGLIIAYWAKRLVTQLLKLVRLDRVSKSMGVESYLSKAEVKYGLVGLVATVFEWLIVLVFFLAAVDILGLAAVSQVLTQVLGYVPNIIAAALIFGAGYFVAGLVEGLVKGALVSVDHAAARPVGKLARWAVLIIAFFAAVDQLQIARGLIATFFQGLTYTIVLAVGLSLGLGAKDLVGKVLSDWYEKVRK